MTVTVRERLLSRLVIDPGADCLRWIGSTNGKGYGVIIIGGRGMMTHRIMYEMFAGPIPDGLQLDHLCRNPICANVDHLEPVTRRENILRGISVTAANARKTHCKRGHEFTAENTLLVAAGRQCRTCANLMKRARRKRRRTS